MNHRLFKPNLERIFGADLPGLQLSNITPTQRYKIVHDKNVPDRNPRRSLGESFDLIRIKEQVSVKN